MRKNIWIYIAWLLVIGLVACEEDLVEKAMVDETITPGTVEALSASDYTLAFENGSTTFEVFSWSATDFGFDAAVTYTLQMDIADSLFSGPVNLSTTEGLKDSVTVGEVNAALLARGASPNVPANVSFRIMATVSAELDPVYSDAGTVSVTPYATTFPPIYMIGGAIGWDLAQAVELTSTGPGEYVGIGGFVNGETFRFFASPSWDAEQWNADFFDGGTLPSDFSHAADNDANFSYGGEDNSFQIYVNLNTKTIELSAAPTLYIIGSDQNWSLPDAFQLTAIGAGKFEGTTEFANGGIWRFFEIPDWGATQHNYADFVDGTLPEFLSGTTEGDANFTFEGTTGIYTISVDLINAVIEMELGEVIVEPEPDGSVLFLVGSDQGWDMGNALQLNNIDAGVFEVVAEFANAGIWRFYREADWGADQYRFADFTTVNGELTSDGGTDDNFLFGGTTGIYKVTVDIENSTITMETSTAPTLFIAGDNNGWSFDEFEWVTGGIFTRTLDLTTGNTFRFFGTNDWVQPQYNYSHFAEGSLPESLVAVGDADDNLRMDGATGTYTMRVDLFGKSITLTQ